MISTLFGCVVFSAILIGLVTVSFCVFYSHTFIQKYSLLTILPLQINNHIAGLNKKYGVNLIEVDHSGDDFSPVKTSESKPRHTSDLVVRAVFSLVVGLSVELIVLMMCELSGSFASSARLVAFKVTINSLILLLTVVEPFLVICLYLSQDVNPLKQGLFKKMATVVCYGVWFLLLNKFGHLSQMFSPDMKHVHSKSLLERKINEVVVGGVTTLATLSGIGSVSTPYEHLGHFSRFRSENRQLRELDLNNTIQSFNHTCLLLQKRKKELEGKAFVEPDTLNSIGGMVHKVLSYASLKLHREKPEAEELQDEITSLESLKNTLYQDLVKSMHKFEAQRESIYRENTLVARVSRMVVVAFSAYCVYRVLNVVFNKLPYYYTYGSDAARLHDKANVISEDEEEVLSTGDALAVTLAKILLVVVNLPVLEPQLVNVIGFILSGGLFLCTFSNVLTTLRSVGKFFPLITMLLLNTVQWLKHLVICELLGVYVISTALLIRTNLPSHLSNQISRILSLSGTSANKSSAKEVELIDLWFDKVFGFAAVVTMIVILLKRFIDRYDHDAYDEYDEEMMVEQLKTA